MNEKEASPQGKGLIDDVFNQKPARIVPLSGEKQEKESVVETKSEKCSNPELPSGEKPSPPKCAKDDSFLKRLKNMIGRKQ